MIYTYSNPCPPKQAKQFRRGQRVRYNDPESVGKSWSRDGDMGTILNPERVVDYRDGTRYVSVRWDSQHPYERGDYCSEEKLTPDNSGETQYEKRRYDIRWLSHQDVALLRQAVGDSTDPAAASLLQRLPVLP